MKIWLGLPFAFASTLAVNWAYTREQSAVQQIVPVSLLQPVRSVRALLKARTWLIALSLEAAGWGAYLAAVHLAPLALVQSIVASGLAVLAILQTRGHPGRLAGSDRAAVAAAVAGLVLLAVSTIGTSPAETRPSPFLAAAWLAACFVAAASVALLQRLALQLKPMIGVGAGVLFAAGDLATKLFTYGGLWLVAAVPLVAGYALGSLQLQQGFQQGEALKAAGAATLTGDAIPIAAGVLLLHETLPRGPMLGLQGAAFALVVLSGTLLARGSGAPAARPGCALGTYVRPGRRTRSVTSKSPSPLAISKSGRDRDRVIAQVTTSGPPQRTC